MITLTKIVAHVIALFVGAMILFTAVGMYPNEESSLQRRIENFWIAVDEKQKPAVERAITVLNGVGLYVTRVYNRILGPRLISVQMIGVSSASSIAAFFFFGVVLFFTLLYLSISRHAKVSPQFNAGLLVVGLVCVFLGSVVLVFAVVPSIIRNWLGRWVSVVPGALFVYGMFLSMTRRGMPSPLSSKIGVLVGLLIGVLTDIFVLAGARFSTRLIANTTRFLKIVWAVLLQVGLLFLIVLVPYEASTPLVNANKNSLTAMALLSSMMFNFFTALGILGFLLLLIALMLYRAVWPTIGRGVYAFAKFKPFHNNRKLCALIGIVCMLYGIGVLDWSHLVVWFANKFNPLK